MRRKLSEPSALRRPPLKALIDTWVADFETVNDPDDCRVWAWAMAPVAKHVANIHVGKGLTLDEFMAHISKMEGIIYFHNLGFDGGFIMDWLLRNGYKHREGRRAKRGEFMTVISDMGQHYTITVKFREGGIIEFRDSVKLLPMTVAAIAKSFGMLVGKGEIDYNANRPAGYRPTYAEWDYVERDVIIVAKALHTVITESHGKITVGANALEEYRKLAGPRFERDFPELSYELDSELRHSYRGGWTYLNPKFADRHIAGKGLVFDVNSLYPDVMYNCPMPCGEPEYYEGDPYESGAHTFITTLTLTAKLKPDHLPCIQIKGHSIFVATEYLEEIPEPTTLTFTSVDLALIFDHYDVEVLEWCGSWLFETSHGLFKEYIDKWSAIKANSKGGLRVLAKLHLNSLYGKFGTNPEVTSKIPVMENDCVRLVLTEPEKRKPMYLPVASFITSYARNKTIRAAQANYDRFIYADTDSLHLLGVEIPDLEIHESNLGAWKQEMVFTEAYYKRAKCYSERNLKTGRLETHIAGLPKQIASQVSLKDFEQPTKFYGKLLPKRVPGGIILTSTEYMLR